MTHRFIIIASLLGVSVLHGGCRGKNAPETSTPADSHAAHQAASNPRPLIIIAPWAAFTGSDAHAAVDGDFAMTADEVQPVLRALRRENIHVVALHNHMVGETPIYDFTHFWAKGPAIELARGFRAALDAQRGVGRERE
jgi:hypothetical protein